MPWTQVTGWDSNKGGTTKNMCLANVRKGYGIAAKYDDAWTAWLNTVQHKDKNFPAETYTPIYFSYIATIDGKTKNYGHIGVRYPDGRFWSDGRVFKSVSEYEKNYAPDFVGWGESVNGVRVIKWVEPAKPKFDMPPVGSKIQLLPKDTRTTYKAGTTTKAGTITVSDNTFVYIVRGVRENRIVINSASAGGNGVELALYYTDGKKIEGWKRV